MAGRPKQLRSVLIKPAGPRCNLACRYCFYLDKGRLFPGTTAYRMTEAVLDETIGQVLACAGPEVSFSWQGGEPTLLGVDFFGRAFELQKRYGRGGQVVGNGLQTNGLLIDEDWCRFLSEAGFLVGLSLDGPEHVHDRYRLSRTGQPTWARVMTSLGRLLDSGVPVNALTVVTEHTANHAGQVYEFHKQSGLDHMQFIPCIEPDPARPGELASFSVSPRRFGEFLCTIFDCWRADFDAGRPTTFVRWFDSVFYTYVGLEPPECTVSAECGDYVVVEHNGDVFACDFFVEERWKLGNVMEAGLGELLNGPKQAAFGRLKSDLPEQCRACRWVEHCQGGCPKERLYNPHDRRLNYFCESFRMFFAHADGFLRDLAERWRREHDPPAVPKGAAGGARRADRVGRNEPCPCGSGRKYKHCCAGSSAPTGRPR